MNETQQRDPTRYREERFEDEIELMDYLRVIWKWKYLIVAGTLICAVAAGVISFSMPTVYRIGMLVRPGILTINQAGQEVYVDSPGNIKAIIEAGAFDRDILNDVGESDNNGLPESLSLKVNIPSGSNVIKVSYETVNADLGLQIMNRLGDLLLQKYHERVKYFQGEYEAQIGLKKAETADYEVRSRAAQQNIKNIQKRIDELTSQIGLIKEKMSSLIQEKDKFLSNNTNESNTPSAGLYRNNIQQNIALENTYRQQIDEYITKREDEQVELEELNADVRRLLEEIKGLEFKKDNVQNIEILKLPTISQHPIKPKIKLNVMLATVVGLFVMLFLTFFLEYIQKHRGEIGGKVK